MWQVAVSEEDDVVEDVVEHVKVEAVRPAVLKRKGFVIGGIEGFSEAAEHAGHGEVSFPVAEIGGGIEKDGLSVLIGSGVPGPEIAVQDCGGLSGISGPVADTGFEGAECGLVCGGEAADHGFEAVGPPEFGPGTGGVGKAGEVFLRGGTDEVIKVEAVVCIGMAMGLGELPAEGFLPIGCGLAEGNEFQQEEVGIGMVHVGDADAVGFV